MVGHFEGACRCTLWDLSLSSDCQNSSNTKQAGALTPSISPNSSGNVEQTSDSTPSAPNCSAIALNCCWASASLWSTISCNTSGLTDGGAEAIAGSYYGLNESWGLGWRRDAWGRGGGQLDGSLCCLHGKFVPELAWIGFCRPYWPSIQRGGFVLSAHH